MATLTQRLTVATWNVHEGLPVTDARPGNRDRVAAELADLVRIHHIDVLAMQEVDFDPAGESAVLSAVLSGTELQHAVARPLSESSFLPGCRSGVAVASGYPVFNADSFLLPNPGLTLEVAGQKGQLHDKGVVMCSVNIGQFDLTIASLHAFPFERFGRKPGEPAFADVWRTVAKGIAGRGGQQLIICGDFNAEDRGLVTDSFDSILTRVFTDGSTHRGKLVDDILLSPGISLAEEPVIVDTFSDHRLCIAELMVARP